MYLDGLAENIEAFARRTKSKAILKHNTIYGGCGPGVFIRVEGHAILEGNQILRAGEWYFNFLNSILKYRCSSRDDSRRAWFAFGWQY